MKIYYFFRKVWYVIDEIISSKIVAIPLLFLVLTLTGKSLYKEFLFVDIFELECSNNFKMSGLGKVEEYNGLIGSLRIKNTQTNEDLYFKTESLTGNCVIMNSKHNILLGEYNASETSSKMGI